MIHHGHTYRVMKLLLNNFRAVWVPSTSTRLPLTARDRAGQTYVVILNEEAKKAYLVDVAVPWGSEDNLKASRERKVEKYSGMKNCLEQKGLEVPCRIPRNLGPRKRLPPDQTGDCSQVQDPVQETVHSRCHFGQLRCVGSPLPTWR